LVVAEFQHEFQPEFQRVLLECCGIRAKLLGDALVCGEHEDDWS
jgi:hypothetical protein